MKRIDTEIPGVFLLEPAVYRDARGQFYETYQAERLRDLGITETFVQDNQSRSIQGTLRGLHYQRKHPQAKLCRVVVGQVLDVVLDIRRGSPTFGRSVSAVLSADNLRQIFVPKGFAHGFIAQSPVVEFLYKCSDYYAPGDERGVRWNDPALGIDFGAATPLVSDKDARLPLLAEIPPEELPVYTA